MMKGSLKHLNSEKMISVFQMVQQTENDFLAVEADYFDS